MMGYTNPRKRARSQMQQMKMEEKNAVGTDGAGLPNNSTVSGGMAGVVEETVRSCLSPLFKELMNGALMGGNGMRGIGGITGGLFNPLLLSFGGPSMVGLGFGGGGEAVDERWRKQQILELEVYLKRLELVQDQIKAKLEELRSPGG